LREVIREERAWTQREAASSFDCIASSKLIAARGCHSVISRRKHAENPALKWLLSPSNDHFCRYIYIYVETSTNIAIKMTIFVLLFGRFTMQNHNEQLWFLMMV